MVVRRFMVSVSILSLAALGWWASLRGWSGNISSEAVAESATGNDLGSTSSSRQSAPGRRQVTNPTKQASLGAETADGEALRTLDDRLSAVEADLRHMLEREPLYADYLRCTSGSTTCLTLLSDAIYSARSLLLGDWKTEYEGELSALADELGAEGFHASMAQRILHANDPVESVAALVVLRELSGVEPMALPESVYIGIHQRTDLEVQLLLGEHAQVPLPSPAVADEVTALVVDPRKDDRVRMVALRAFGYSESAEHMASIADAILADPAGFEGIVFANLGQVLGRCGMACSDTIEKLSRSQNNVLRTAVLGAVNSVPPQSQDAMFDLLARSFDVAEQDLRSKYESGDLGRPSF